jgi:hypothetical protein
MEKEKFKNMARKTSMIEFRRKSHFEEEKELESTNKDHLIARLKI